MLRLVPCRKRLANFAYGPSDLTRLRDLGPAAASSQWPLLTIFHVTVRKPPYSYKRLLNGYKVRLNIYKIKR